VSQVSQVVQVETQVPLAWSHRSQGPQVLVHAPVAASHVSQAAHFGASTQSPFCWQMAT